MLEPTTASTAALLYAAARGLARGAGAAAGRGLLARAWSAFGRRLMVRRAVKAAAKRHPYPGVKAFLNAWRTSAAFANLVMRAEAGDGNSLNDQRIASSFIEANPGLGWGTATEERARKVTRSFLEHLFDELVKGPNGHAVQRRLLEGHHVENQTGLRNIESQMGGLIDEVHQLIQSEILPEPVRSALAQPALDELSSYLREGNAQAALDLATRRTDAIEKALSDAPDSREHITSVLRSHRQRLLFAATTAASWLGDVEGGRAYWRRARQLGHIDPEWHDQAAAALFNVELADDLRDLVARMEAGSRSRRTAEALLAVLNGEWHRVESQLPDSDGVDILLRTQARIQLLDPTDAEAVRAATVLLDNADAEGVLPKLAILGAHLTHDLLRRVVDGETPLGFDRRPLIDALIRRTIEALNATAPDTRLRAQAVGAVGATAMLLRDGSLKATFEAEVEALSEPLRSASFVLHSPPAKLAEIEEMEKKGRLRPYEAAVLKAAHYDDRRQPEEAERVLREALFTSPNEYERAAVLRVLTRLLAREGRIEAADSLVQSVPVSEGSKWLLKTQLSGAGPAYEEAEAYPLNVPILEWVASEAVRTLDEADEDEGEEEDGGARHPIADAAVKWTKRYAMVLPARSAYHLHAEALYLAGQYADLLEVSSELDPVYAERAAELRAWALDGLGRRTEAADSLAEAARHHPDSERLAVNASALLLQDNRPSEAEELLRPHIEESAPSPGVLVNSARSLLAQAPDDREKASKAFDLLERAYDIDPSPQIAAEAWKAARGAHREREASPYFAAMVGEAPEVEVESAEDLDEALASSGHRLVRYKGGLDTVAERIAKDRERTDALNRMAGAQALAYVDLFRAAGRSWEHWTQWTERFRQAVQSGSVQNGAYSVLADWPSGAMTQLRARSSGEDPGILAESTALLTLGVLGQERAERLINALGKLHVEKGTFDGLQEQLNRLESDVLIGSARPYTETADLLRTTPAALVPYDEKVEQAAPDDAALGASRVDLGVAINLGGRYVIDLDRTTDWEEGAAATAISSTALLASLNAAGLVSADAARAAAEVNPAAFGGWDAESEVTTAPEAIVFDPFVILDWIEAGLFDVIRDRVRVGPWAWTHIAGEADRQESTSLAYRRLRGVTEVLRAARERGAVIEVEPHVPSGVDEDNPLETAWSGALRALRTAREHGLQLWADDRFYPLLTWFGGPTIEGPGVEAIRDELADWGEATPPIPTVEVVADLVGTERLSAEEAERIATALFKSGYRPAHPLTLHGLLKQYRTPESPPLPPPLASIAGSIAGTGSFISDAIPAPRRDGFTRVASSSVAKRLITAAWTADGLSDDQRRTLADAFLDAIEGLWRAHSPTPQAPRSDRTTILFWQVLGAELQLLPAGDQESWRRRTEGLRWLGNAASERSERREDIVRLLEDNALAAVYLAGGSPASELDDAFTSSMGGFALASLEPLFAPQFLPILDPLLRRTVGTLAGLERGGCVDTLYRLNIKGATVEITVPEERGEDAAANLIRQIIRGNKSYLGMIHATDLVFEYVRPPTAEWEEAGLPPETKVPFTVRCSLFTLLWRGDSDIREAVIGLLIYHLATLDPGLAHAVARAKDRLMSDEGVEDALQGLAIELLRSGFFDLQRDLTHALWRYRNYDSGAFQRFLGQIGEDDANEVFEAVQEMAGPDVPVHALGPVLVPREHLLGRVVLSAPLDDTASVVQAVQTMESTGAEGDGPSLAAWLEDRATLAESATDPFTAAWALRHFLAALSATSGDPLIDVSGKKQRASNWATDYLTVALTVGEGSPSPLEQHMTARRGLAAAALQLAAFACSGDSRLNAFNQSEDPLIAWLDGVWLLASKLQVGLVGLNGGLSGAVAAATNAVQDLGLATPGARVLDAFDPFAFGPDGDDIGTALTLMAMLSPLDDATDTPDWWKPTVCDAVEAIASREPDAQDQTAGDTGNRFDLSSPLRSRTLAAAVQAAVPPV